TGAAGAARTARRRPRRRVRARPTRKGRRAGPPAAPPWSPRRTGCRRRRTAVGLADERPRAAAEPPWQRDIERLVGQIDAVPTPPVRDPDDGGRGGDCNRPPAGQPLPRAVEPRTPT